MGDARDHIDAWQAAGIIDAPTADRLRVFEGGRAASLEGVPTGPTDHGPALVDPRSVASVFGPPVAIGEMFGYLGAAFLLAAWAAFVARAASGSDLALGMGAAAAAAVLALLGARLRLGDSRRRRAAGVAFVASSVCISIAAYLVADTAGLGAPAIGIVASGAALAVAIAFRAIHPSLLTQLGLLGALTALAGSTLRWLESVLVQRATFDDSGDLVARVGPDPILLVVGEALWWLGWALLIGYLGLVEARRVGADPEAGRRAAASRLWAGLVAVIGLTLAVTTTDYGPGFVSERVVPAWLGDLAILALSVVLVERAFRRDATAYIWAAALGVIIALTDLNFTYVSDRTEVALLIEGVILLAVGLWADRLRRRLRGPGPSASAVAT